MYKNICHFLPEQQFQNYVPVLFQKIKTKTIINGFKSFSTLLIAKKLLKKKVALKQGESESLIQILWELNLLVGIRNHTNIIGFIVFILMKNCKDINEMNFDGISKQRNISSQFCRMTHIFLSESTV